MTAPVRMDNALKGLAAGVTVTSASGQPGAAARIRVRGIGTINNSDPLYIVDGMPIEGGLDYVNPSDIESIEVLKDAASGAIYGARGQRQVVLVTTKSGTKGKVKVNYNFSYGWQSKWRKRDLLDATEYAVMMNEGYTNAGMEAPYADPYSLTDAMGRPVTTGTDWQDEVFYDNAPVVNHDVTVSGATDNVNYYLSLGYYTQDGIVGGNFGRSDYQRLSLRSNTRYKVFDESKKRNWLNKARRHGEPLLRPREEPRHRGELAVRLAARRGTGPLAHTDAHPHRRGRRGAGRVLPPDTARLSRPDILAVGRTLHHLGHDVQRHGQPAGHAVAPRSAELEPQVRGQLRRRACKYGTD